MSVNGSKESIGSLDQHLVSRKIDPSLWQLSKTCDQLFFTADLWPLIDFTNARLKVSYSGTTLKSSVSFQNPFKEVVLNKKKKVVVERQTLEPGLWFEGDQIPEFGHRFVQPDIKLSREIPETMPQDLMEGALAYEAFRQGLGEYF